jgi:hypothetical protein
MVRTLTDVPGLVLGRLCSGSRAREGRAPTGALIAGLLILNCGCGLVPRAQVDECLKIGQTLRSENARLKDRVLALQSQNRDYAERAVDDARRLAIQDEAIKRLEHSVQAYQDERDRLEAAFKRLVSNLDATGSREEQRLGRSGSDAPVKAEASSRMKVGPRQSGRGADK